MVVNFIERSKLALRIKRLHRMAGLKITVLLGLLLNQQFALFQERLMTFVILILMELLVKVGETGDTPQ